MRKCFALNRKSRNGTGTIFLSRLCVAVLTAAGLLCSAHGRRVAHVPKLRHQHFVSYADGELSSAAMRFHQARDHFSERRNNQRTFLWPPTSQRVTM